MKQLSVALALILFVISSSAEAQSSAQKKALVRLDEELSVAYMSKDLGRLDASRQHNGRVRVVIEHSLGTGAGQFESRVFGTFGAVERWLKSREREDGTPIRETRDLIRCSRGICTYDFDGGILHNHLYIRKLAYGLRNGRPYIKTMFLLDGD